MVVFHRRLPRFELLAPATLEEALKLLDQYRERARVMAGGTDLVPKLKRRDIEGAEFLIDLRNIPGLDFIQEDQGGTLRVGGLASLRAIEKSRLIRDNFNLLSQAAATVGSIQVRNRATVAGNICNAVPSADMAPALLTLEAGLLLTGRHGARQVKIEDFFSGPNRTVISPIEILSEIQIRKLPADARGVYLKLSPRGAMDLAVVGVAVVARAENGLCRLMRIGLGAVAPTPIRATRAEDIMLGQRVSPALIEQAAEAAAAQSRPIDDHRASAEYRREMVKVLTDRAIRIALSI
jgi:CO/xanthine dehydrogenase FAD-binding subunit